MGKLDKRCEKEEIFGRKIPEFSGSKKGKKTHLPSIDNSTPQPQSHFQSKIREWNHSGNTWIYWKRDHQPLPRSSLRVGPLKGSSHKKVTDCIPKILTPDHSAALMKIISLQEVDTTINQMEDDKSPGLYGFTTNYFHHC